MEQNKREKHRSFGMLDISKFNSNGSQFFGSDLKHPGGITITISGAEVEHHLSREWYYPKERLIRIRMTHTQFVDAMTSDMNTNGIPCTIEYVNGERVEEIDHATNKVDTFRTDMADTLNGLFKRIDDVIQKLDEEPMGKRKVEEIKHDIEVVRNHLASNTQFVMDSFNKAMVQTVSEAKHSIAAYVEDKIRRTGLEALAKDTKSYLQIGNGEIEESNQITE